MIQAIETTYKGYRFRSRTEARWAIFFEYAGVAFDYEPEGMVLDGKPYLPDFWLPTARVWFEVKGAAPTPQEISLCAKLSLESGNQCLLAIGPPNQTNFIRRFNSAEGDWLGDGQSRFQFIGMDGGLFLGEHNGGNYLKVLADCQNISRAYEAAHSARFEHGETGASIERRTYRDMRASPELRNRIGKWRG